PAFPVKVNKEVCFGIGMRFLLIYEYNAYFADFYGTKNASWIIIFNIKVHVLRNYLKTAFRPLSKNKLYSAINVFGLAAGICCTLLAVLCWNDEQSFDKFHKNDPHIYRITSSFVNEKG